MRAARSCASTPRSCARSRACTISCVAAPAGVHRGSVARDLRVVRLQVSAFLRVIADSGPEHLARDAARLLASDDPAIDGVLPSSWQTPSNQEFFPKAVLQPYAQWLAETGVAPAGQTLPRRQPVPVLRKSAAALDPGAPGRGDGQRRRASLTIGRIKATRRTRARSEVHVDYFYALRLY